MKHPVWLGGLIAMGLATGCATRELPAAGRPLVHPAARVSQRPDCPAEPALEWHTVTMVDGHDAPGAPFGVAGHVLAIDVDDAPAASVVGVLDPKGSLAMERHTNALAQRTWTDRARDPTASPQRFALVLDHRVLATVDVVTTLRGRRFRIPLDPDAPAPSVGQRLRDAAADDRRCFAGRAPAP